MAECINHPGTEAVQHCPACGRPFCADCMIELQGVRYCGPCKDAKVQVLQKETSEKKRPTSVIVFGILNIVLGALGLLLSPLYLLGLSSEQSGKDPATDLIMQTPMLHLWTFGTGVVGVVANAVLIAAGVGLLFLKPWGRFMSVGCAIYEICITVTGLLINFFFLTLPLLQEISRSNNDDAIGGAIGAPIAGTGCGCYLIYPIFLLIFMTRPGVAQAFRKT